MKEQSLMMIKDSRVYVKVYARGGNQLFMYVAGRSLANRLNCDLVLDRGSFEPKTTQNELLTSPATRANTFCIIFKCALRKW